MPTITHPAARQLTQLLQEKLIPWAQNAAPLVLLDTPPRTSAPVGIREQETPILPSLRPPLKYPHIHRWPQQRLNAISVTVLGCIFEGEADYRVHSAPGEKGREWIVPVKQGTLFVIPPSTPFSDGSGIAWERPEPATAFSRGILMHLRRDGVSCHTFTCQNEKLWLHPYVFLYHHEVWLLGEKLIGEMKAQPRMEHAVALLYWQLILRLLLRSVSCGEYSALRGAATSLLIGEDEHPPQAMPPERIVGATAEYIQSRLGDAGLSSQLVARHVGLSERHLNRLFEKEMGLSLFGYIQQQRSEKARDLLSHSEISISEVASYCGFRRLSVFSAWFARQHHMPPSQYRQQQGRSNTVSR